ncbi:hypothetical protein [Bradyrhizobium sp. LHD-71]|nr:hypothetical protein [Bradyrhizobium sp. LHD-71]MDQ8727523.1 hypothetical protein [Bradyrhizobium sp. LHD-71]
MGTGQAEYQLFAESEGSFFIFMYLTNAQTVFVRNADGKADRLLWQ